MSLHISIPQIAITPEDEEDDDHDLLDLAEALTDVEELFENVDTRRNSFRKKLRIKLTDNDGYNTAMEDVEASDEEDPTPMIQHDCPISLDDLDLEQFATEENYGVSNRKSDDFEYSRLQFSRTDDSFLSISPQALDDSALTDVENYETENEVEVDDIPDLEMNFDNGEGLQITTITDEMQENEQQQPQHLEGATPLNPSVFPSTLFEERESKPPVKRAPTFRQMMKGKANAGQAKMRKRKRNKHNRKTNEYKETHENDSSENESKKNIKTYPITNSLNYESDEEEDKKLQFPICKKTFAKNKLHLTMPEFDVNDKTDVEDFEVDADTFKRRISVDSTIFQKQLDEMASCYSFTKDSNETKLKNYEERETLPVSTLNLNDGGLNVLQREDLAESTLDSIEVGGLTDIEDVSDAQYGEQADNHTNETNSECDTDEELIKGNPEDFNDVPDIILPPPTRTLVIAEENRSLIPTVRIFPLDGNVDLDSECEEKSTDDESMNSDNEFTMNRTRNLPSPQLPMVEGENVKVSENSINPLFDKLAIDEVATDVEELEGEPCRLTKQIGNGRIFLSPNDTSARYRKESENEGHTDLEYLDSSDDDSFSKTELQRPKNFVMKLNCPLNFQGHTDTEDLGASSDDEINYSRAETATPLEVRKEIHDYDIAPEEVMYLKGGCCQDGLPYMVQDTESQFQDVMDAWEYFNHAKSTYACERGETSHTSEPSDTTTTKDHQASTSERDEEEVNFHTRIDSIKQHQMDQHQLSSEMRDLLREMEEASKK